MSLNSHILRKCNSLPPLERCRRKTDFNGVDDIPLSTTARKLSLCETNIMSDFVLTSNPFPEPKTPDIDEEKSQNNDDMDDGEISNEKIFLEELPFWDFIFETESPSTEITSDIALQIEVVKAEGYNLGGRYARTHDDELDEAEGEYVDRTCYICFETVRNNQILTCNNCELFICFQCMTSHVEAKVLDGVVKISCAGDSCRHILSDQIVSAFAPESMRIYMKNKVEIENDPNKKTCPNCHKLEIRTGSNTIPKIKCSSCKSLWCFNCHAPWHSNVTCNKFQRDVKGTGGKALKYWAKSKGKESSNAKKCPSCHFYIERISGCDHMTCNRCHTDFCYKCGSKHRSFGWFGDHYSTYSFLGCKYNLHPRKKALRISMRSSVLMGVVIATPVVASLAVTAAVVCLGLSPVILPIYACKKSCK